MAKITGSRFNSTRNPHYLQAHPEYTKWVKRWRRNGISIDLLFILALVTTGILYGSRGEYFLLPIWGLSFVAFLFYEFEYLLKRARRQYVLQWMEQHPREGTTWIEPTA